MSAPSPVRLGRPKRQATDTRALAAAVRNDAEDDLRLTSDDDDTVAVRYAAPSAPVAGPSALSGGTIDPAKPPRKKPGPKPGYKRPPKVAAGAATATPASAAAAKPKQAAPKRRKIEDALGMTIISALEFPLEDEDPPSAGAGDGSVRSSSAKPAAGATGGSRGGIAIPPSAGGGAFPLGKDGKEHPLQDFLKNPAVEHLKAPKEPAFDLRSVKTSSPRVPPPRTQARVFNLSEAPTYYPSATEFADAIGYVRKIGEQGARDFGICKIVPPPGWEMPFLMETETFKFRTRLMRLNSIEAKSRAKLNFLEQLSMFHSQQGNPRLTVPVIDKREVDLWVLRKEVTALGGETAVSYSRAWGTICRKIGLAPAFAQSVRNVYGRIIAPYEDYAVRAKNTLAKMSPRKKKANAAERGGMKRRRRSSSLSTLPNESPVKESPGKIRRRLAEEAARMFVDGDSDLTDTDEETIRMVAEPVAGPSKAAAGSNGANKRRASSISSSSDDEDAEDVCEVCHKGDRPTKMLLCDGCDLGFHIFCLDPPLEDIPENETWYCPSCLIGNGAEFGFDEGDEHSLSTFQKRDTAFSQYWWAMHPPKAKVRARDEAEPGPNGVERDVLGVQVSEHDVETEFWRLVDSKNETVEVEYGADIHSTIHGSAAPTIETHPLHPYAIDQWNLNNLSILPDSLLRYVKTPISGCTVPWIYVGHLFSAFCWHNEDHHTHSINHMHWGETKTWYGVPGEDAEKFEEALRREAPDLFEQDPALLFQLVTLMNPGRLRKAGVRVYALDQRANEIVITFPKAFHAGFNHGLNYNEAVNFATREWLSDDLACVRKYQEHTKAPVFSHDELLVSIAHNSPTIDTALWLTASFNEMVEREREARNDSRLGPVELPETLLEADLPEEQYQCAECKVFTYLSQIVCSGCDEVLCHSHASQPCSCAPGVPRTMRVRYADDKLEQLRGKIAENAALPTLWREKFTKVLQTGTPSLKSLRTLVVEAEQIEKMTTLPELDPLRAFVGRCNEIVQEAITLLTRKHKSRKGRISGFEGEDGEDRTLDGVREVLFQAERLGFEAGEVVQLQHVLAQALAFVQEANELLQSPDVEHSLTKVEALYATGSSLGLNLPQCSALEKISKRMRWLTDLDEVDESSLDLDDIQSYLDLARQNDVPADHAFVKVLEDRLASGLVWKRSAEALLQPNASITIEQLEQNIAQSNDTSIDTAILHRIKQLRHKALDVQRQARTLLDRPVRGASVVNDVRRFLQRLETYKIDTVVMPEIATLEQAVAGVDDWRRRLADLLGLPDKKGDLQTELGGIVDRLDELNAFPYDEAPATGFGLFGPDSKCFCRLPERDGPTLQCIKCFGIYHGECLDIPAKSVKAFKRYVCNICDPKKIEAWTSEGRPSLIKLEAMLEEEPVKLRLDALDDEPLDFLRDICENGRNWVDDIQAVLASAPSPRDVQHWLRKLERFPLHLETVGPEGVPLDLRSQMLAVVGLDKRRVRKQNPRWQIIGTAPSKDPNIVQCFCDPYPPPDAPFTALCNNRRCQQRFHASCVLIPPEMPVQPADPTQPPLPPPMPPLERSFKCPLCCIKQGTRYQHAELRLQMEEDLGTQTYVDYRSTLSIVDDMAKFVSPPPLGACITLVATAFTPGVKGDPKPIPNSPAGDTAGGPSSSTHGPVSNNPWERLLGLAPLHAHAPRAMVDAPGAGPAVAVPGMPQVGVPPPTGPIQYRSLPPQAVPPAFAPTASTPQSPALLPPPPLLPAQHAQASRIPALAAASPLTSSGPTPSSPLHTPSAI